MQVLKRNPNSPFPTPSQVFSEHGGWEMKAPSPALPCWSGCRPTHYHKPVNGDVHTHSLRYAARVSEYKGAHLEHPSLWNENQLGAHISTPRFMLRKTSEDKRCTIYTAFAAEATVFFLTKCSTVTMIFRTLTPYLEAVVFLWKNPSTALANKTPDVFLRPVRSVNQVELRRWPAAPFPGGV